MSVKKLLILTAAGIASLGVTAAFAGGPDVAVADNGVYVDVNLGYAWADWSYVVPGTAAIVWGDNNTGGFTIGGDIGYQWNQYLAAEFGYWYLPTVSFTDTTVGNNLYNYALYLAMKFMAPITDNFDIFFKGGVAYRYASTSGFTAAHPLAVTQTEIVPTFAVGLQYNYTPNWRFNVMYTYIGSANYGLAGSPNVNSLTVGVGYLFTL